VLGAALMSQVARVFAPKPASGPKHRPHLASGRTGEINPEVKRFAELGVDRVYATTMAVNTASRRVMEKAGQRYVRTFDAAWPVKIRGDEEGDLEYAIDQAQWEHDRAASPRQ
jgi:hypothetical protein